MRRVFRALNQVRVPGPLLAAAFAMFAILVMRIIVVESPVMASDEYAYFMTAKYDAVKEDVYRYDPAMQAVDNQVYPLLFDIWEAVSAERTALVGRVFNALLYVLSAFLLCAVFSRAFDRKTAAIAAMLYLLFPFSFYATTLLPEVEFQFCIYLTVFAVLYSARARTLSVLVPAMLSATAYFVKPHAVALIVATFAFYIVAGPMTLASKMGVLCHLWRGLLRATVYLLAVAILIYVGKKLPLGESKSADVVSSFYGGYLARLSDPAYLANNAYSMLDYVVGHVWVLLVLFTPGLIAVLGVYKRYGSRIAALWRSKGYEEFPVARGEEDRRELLGILVGLLCLSFLLMIAAFTNSASQVSEFEKYRLHGRYLEPLLPFLLAFSVWSVRFSHRARLIGTTSALSLVFFVLYLRFQYHIYPWDYPDIFGFFTSEMKHWSLAGINNSLVWIILASGIVFAVACFFARSRLVLYLTYLVVIMLASHVQMSNWLHEHSETNRAVIESGDALKDYLGDARPGTGVVLVTERYGKSSYFLMEFGNLQYVQSVAAGGKIESKDLPDRIEWLVAPKGVSIEVPFSKSLDFGDQTLYVLARNKTSMRSDGNCPNITAERCQ